MHSEYLIRQVGFGAVSVPPCERQSAFLQLDLDFLCFALLCFALLCSALFITALCCSWLCYSAHPSCHRTYLLGFSSFSFLFFPTAGGSHLHMDLTTDAGGVVIYSAKTQATSHKGNQLLWKGKERSRGPSVLGRGGYMPVFSLSGCGPAARPPPKGYLLVSDTSTRGVGAKVRIGVR